MPQPPVTQLRPLHSYQQPVSQDLERQSSRGQDTIENDSQLLHWSSTLKPFPDFDTYIRAFVKLVSRVVVLEPGEPYCIQDSTRGGFILAHSGTSGHEGEKGQDGAYSFIAYPAGHSIPTDFSIGNGKVS